MTAVWVILAVIGYFIIGGFLCGLLDEDENMFVYCLWPCIPILYLLGALCVCFLRNLELPYDVQYAIERKRKND